jgi:deoxyribodipyrimidine photo-lyase
MSGPPLFPPARAAARARIEAVRPNDYARSRNAIEGAVTQLSPYITHGLITLPEVLAGVAAKHRLSVGHKLVFELGWREYFRHVWLHQGAHIFQSLHTGPLPDMAYAPALPIDIRQARTGVPAIDQAVQTLYATGTLHNHARMWLASYVVHVRKVHWRAGADWLYAHLLDGDLASNHLSWQWVAGTGSHKPYVFNAENVAKYAPAAWHSPGSAIDQSYETMQALASRPGTNAVWERPAGMGTTEPPLTAAPDGRFASAPDPALVAGRDVWLVHPWALGEPPDDLPADCLRLGWWPLDFHAEWPWSEARWAFVGQRMAHLTASRWACGSSQLADALAGAQSVHTPFDPHVDALLPRCVTQRPATPLFAPVEQPCGSFSQWWARTTRPVMHLHQLPGLAHLAQEGSAGPLFTEQAPTP